MGALIYTGLVVSLIGTLGAPLIPLIVREQRVSFVAAQWILTITLLVGAVAGPTLGRLGDGPRRKGVLMGGLGAVVLGAVVAATAWNFPQLLVGRALMGIGLGLMPLTFAIARDCLPRLTGVRAVAVLSVSVASGTGLGYPLTGVIADHVDYRYAFWLAGLLCAAAVGLVAVAVPPARTGLAALAPRRPFDVPGAALLGLALGAVLLGFSQAPRWGWESAPVLGLFAASVVLAAVWVRVEHASAAPLVELRFLSVPAVLVSNGAAALLGFGMFGTVSLVIRLVETPTSAGYGFGGGVSLAGLMIMPLSVGTLAATRVARVAERRFGTAAVLVLGGLVSTAASLGLAVRHDHLVEIAAATALLGVGIGTGFAAMPTLIITHVPLTETGSATSFNQAMRVVGGSMGSALAASLLEGFTPAGTPLPRDTGYSVAFLMLGLVSLLGALLGLTLRRDRKARAGALPAVPAQEVTAAAEAPATLGAGRPASAT
ncbi:MFS transporter [Frankia sp. CNm7]|uniref:MFS transporter n=1 Tax=Frankia nepalensis TaxID=1836974 RepID=A0A937REV8_9ACTN|nr:MFS transporter [Frankia nepalensis]MBL7509660.1 MFS transporter [Frankia nepalensis]MBL7519153.1 MFS transporter [Frankia nepalensis]MBL7630843.1 MFS transporter [Frankia nepalensis]